MPKSISSSVSATKALAKNLAKKILKNGPQKRATVLALQGELGSGKTTFLQGFAQGLGIKERVLSPTFLIMKQYKIQDTRYKTSITLTATA